MHPTALALRDFLQYAMHELTAYRSGVVLELSRPWKADDGDFSDIATVLSVLARRTSLTAVAFRGDTTSRSKLGRQSNAQVKMITNRRAQVPDKVLVFDDPSATFVRRTDLESMPRVIIIDDISHPERDTAHSVAYARLYKLHSIVRRRPEIVYDDTITNRWREFFACYCDSNVRSPDSMRRISP